MTPEGRPRRTDPARRRAAAASRADALVTSVREISLNGMRFHTLIGILEHERTTPQPLEVDLTVHASANGGILDYRRLYELVAQHVGAGPTDYLETIADRIARATLEDARVEHVRVAVRKPHVALPGPLAYAEVVARLDREKRS
jgi:7,8-dihydroneopterin aldolase/epimerase/oxygenase